MLISDILKSDFQKENLSAVTVSESVSVSAFYKVGSRYHMVMSISVSSDLNLYDNIEVCTINPSDSPKYGDAYNVVVSGSFLGVMIIYSTGKIVLRPYLNPISKGQSISANFYWDVI